MRISDWSSDVCSSDLQVADGGFEIGLATIGNHDEQRIAHTQLAIEGIPRDVPIPRVSDHADHRQMLPPSRQHGVGIVIAHHLATRNALRDDAVERARSEEHTSELQSLMRSSYAVF